MLKAIITLKDGRQITHDNCQAVGMGNYIGYSDKKGERHGERLGSNGSGQALMKLFAVAYGSTKLPHAARARRAILPYNGSNGSVSWSFVHPSSAHEVKGLLRLNESDRFWANFSLKTAGSGYFLKKPNCRIYQGVLLPLMLWKICEGTVVIPAGEPICKVAEAWNTLLPELSESPAIQTLTNMARLAQEAKDCDQALQIG